jgi:hypothetical protein
VNRGEEKNGRLEHKKEGRDGVKVARDNPKKRRQPMELRPPRCLRHVHPCKVITIFIQHTHKQLG